jgi:hypothetical protein
MRSHDTCTLRNPRPEEELLFACTRQQFLPCHRRCLVRLARQHAIPWDTVYSIAASHGVAPLVFTSLTQCPEILPLIPPVITEKFTRCIRNNHLAKSLFQERARGIVEFFARRSIPVLLIKGAGLDATVYRQSWYTMSADLDLMVQCHATDFPAPDRPALRELVKGRNSLERRVSVEFEWFGHHDVSMNGLVPVDFAAIWNQARSVKLLDQRALVMSPEHLLLAACINSCRKRFFRLKALCDISEIIRTQAMNWDQFAQTARTWHCESIAYTALSAAKMTLGSPIPGALPNTLGVPSIRQFVIRFLSRRLSFSSLSTLNGGRQVRNRRFGAGLLLPLAIYRWPQLLRNVTIVCLGS